MSKKKYYVNNVWDKEEFRRCALGKKFKMPAILKYLIKMYKMELSAYSQRLCGV